MSDYRKYGHDQYNTVDPVQRSRNRRDQAAENAALAMAALLSSRRVDIENIIAATTPGGIEAQEACGQRDMALTFNTLPKEGDRAIAEKFGFVYGKSVDDLFFSVTAPEGWSIRPTDHSMYSDIVDEQGRVRGSIFYKAAFYDRAAHMHWKNRYRVLNVYSDNRDGSRIEQATDTATGEIFTSVHCADKADTETWAQFDTRQQAIAKISKDFLDEKFPDWQNPTAYW